MRIEPPSGKSAWIFFSCFVEDVSPNGGSQRDATMQLQSCKKSRAVTEWRQHGAKLAPQRMRLGTRLARPGATRRARGHQVVIRTAFVMQRWLSRCHLAPFCWTNSEAAPACSFERCLWPYELHVAESAVGVTALNRAQSRCLCTARRLASGLVSRTRESHFAGWRKRAFSKERALE